MSFGYSVGDFIAVGQLCWTVYKKCKDSPGNYVELSTEVGALHNVIKETEELLSQQDLTSQQKVKLTACRQGCEEVLKDLDRILIKYESLGTKSRRTFDRMGFGMQDMNGIRLRLISNVSMLDAFNNTSSHAKLEKKLNLLIAEVRAGKREGSVISTQSFDNIAQNDQETWEALRRELEDIGISSSIISEKRQFIIAWFRDAVAAGQLEEDVLSDDNNSAISLSEADSWAGTSDDDGLSDEKILPARIQPEQIHQTAQTKQSRPDRPDNTTQTRVTARRIRPDASDLLKQPAASSTSQLPQKKGKSQLSVTYMLNKLQGRDKRFLRAASLGIEPQLEVLLHKGADIHARDHERCTALHFASGFGKGETVRVLLSKGADIHAKDRFGRTALHKAASLGYEQAVRLLLEQGANIEEKDPCGNTALIGAAWDGHQAIVQLLLEQGADIESRSSDGRTALSYAASAGQQAIVRRLLRKGADIESKSSGGWTALLYAADGGHIAIVQMLLEKGADIEPKNSDGWIALIFAASDGNKAMVQLLLEKGARVDSKDANGRTALKWADRNRHKTVVSLLRSAGARD